MSPFSLTPHMPGLVRAENESLSECLSFVKHSNGAEPALLELRKTAQQFQSKALAFLRVKLRGVDIVLPHHGSKWTRIVRLGRHDARIARGDVIRMHEIEMASIRCPIQKRGTAANAQRVPAHVRNLEPGDLAEANDV